MEPCENIDLRFLQSLQPNDILFIDNSHRILPNSDAMVFFMEILPTLPKGVIVQMHDIFLPYDYPQIMCDRFYSEQYGLAFFFLSNSEKFEIIMPNFFVHKDKELANIVSQIWEQLNLQNIKQHGGSFWFRIN